MNCHVSSTYSLSHLSDQALLRDLAALVAQDRITTAALLAHLAEVDERKLYLPAAHPSMYSYCVHDLHLSEDAACKRIRAARAARQFPAIFAAVADGRLNLSAVIQIAPYLSEETANELLAAAAHQSKTQIEQLLADRFPRPDVPASVQAMRRLYPARNRPCSQRRYPPRGGLKYPNRDRRWRRSRLSGLRSSSP